MRMNAFQVDQQDPRAAYRERTYNALNDLLQRLPQGPLYDATLRRMNDIREGGNADVAAQTRNANPIVARQSAPRALPAPMPVSAPVVRNIQPAPVQDRVITDKRDLPYPWNTLKGMRGGTRMNGLGQFEIASAAMKLLGPMIGGGASGNGGTPPIQNTVSTSVQTTVSPQISPVFVQQSSPSNSPVSTGVTQASPAPMSATFPGQPAMQNPAPYGGTPITGAMPGFDSASGFLPTGIPALPSMTQTQPGITGGTMLAVAALIGGAFFIRSRKRKAKGRR